MYPGAYAATTPDRPAAVMSDTGEVLTYAALEDGSARIARMLHRRGLRRGDTFAVLAENTLRMYELHWAALRSGLYITAISHPRHPTWTTTGDLGYVDDDGYLFLTDRQAFMIISGGVNIYPQEIEDVLTLHPKVFDIAVIGIPDAEMGEQVKAVVQPAPGVDPGPELEAELLAYVRERLAHYKAPRSVDFTDRLPRTPTGKLQKRLLVQQYR